MTRVLIAHVDRDDANHARAESALLATADRPLAVSVVTIAEVLVGPARAVRLDAARAALRDLAVDEVSIPTGAAGQLAELRARTGLKLPDCCVLLTASQVGADAVLTFDDRLDKRAQELGFEPAIPDRPNGL